MGQRTRLTADVGQRMELRHPYGLAGSHSSYALALAAIGHFLVRERARGVMVVELGSGYLVTWHSPTHWEQACHRTVEHDEILDQTGSLQGALLKVEKAREPARKRLFRKAEVPLDMTRADFLQALGMRLDRQRAVAITLIEIAHGFRVLYWVDKAAFVIRGTGRQPVSLLHDETFDREAMETAVANEKIQREKDLAAIEHTLITSPKDYQALLAAVANLEADLRYRDAEELSVRIATQLPERDEAHYHAARLAFARRAHATAAERLQPALAAPEPLPEALDLHARLLWTYGRTNEALEFWERATHTDPPIAIHHQRYARALTVAGRHEEAAWHAHAAEPRAIAPTREMAVEMLAAEAAGAKGMQAPILRRATDHALPLTPNPVYDSGEAPQPFVTGAETIPERARGPLSARLAASNKPAVQTDEVVEQEVEAKDHEVAELQARLAGNPQDSALLRKLGFALARNGQLDAAADAYRRAIQFDTRR